MLSGASSYFSRQKSKKVLIFLYTKYQFWWFRNKITVCHEIIEVENMMLREKKAAWAVVRDYAFSAKVQWLKIRLSKWAERVANFTFWGQKYKLCWNEFNKFLKIIEMFIESEFENVRKNFKMVNFERKNKCLPKLRTLTSKASRKLLDFYKSATSSNIASFF